VIEPKNRRLSVSKQCRLLNISRSRHYYHSRPEPVRDIAEKIALKEAYLQVPFYGYRKMARELQYVGIKSTPKRVRRLMYQMGLKALSPKKLTSRPSKEHPIYPYLLMNKRIRYPNQVWAADITYLKLEKGFAYLVAIMDVYSRKVLSSAHCPNDLLVVRIMLPCSYLVLTTWKNRFACSFVSPS
jgi:putative transposase